MSEQKPESVYAKGLYFNVNHPDTPDSVKEWKKGSVSVHIDNFIEQLTGLKAKADQKGYIRFDLTKNEKNGEVFYSFRLNDWKPPVKEGEEKTKDSEVPW
jgi:hypothetical protein